LKIESSSSTESGANNQESPSVIGANILSAGIPSIGYFPNLEECAVRYDGNYKTVFFSFGFEAISTKDSRVEVMRRVLEYFDEIQGEDELQLAGCGLHVFPTPCSGVMNLRYRVGQLANVVAGSEYVICDIFSIEGLMIKRLMNEEVVAGEHVMTVDLIDLPAGIYFVRLQADDVIETAKIVVAN